MASTAKNAQQLARRLFQLSVVDGAVSPERVSGVLAYVEKHRPANPIQVLRAYHRLVAIELSKGRAVVEHAGAIGDATLAAIATTMTKKYSRPVTALARQNDALLAGLALGLAAGSDWGVTAFVLAAGLPLLVWCHRSGQAAGRPGFRKRQAVPPRPGAGSAPPHSLPHGTQRMRVGHGPRDIIYI